MEQPDSQSAPLLGRNTSGGFMNQAGERINLRASTVATSIHNIESANNSFDCDFTLALYWDDPKVEKAGMEVGTHITLGGGHLDMDYRPDVSSSTT